MPRIGAALRSAGAQETASEAHLNHLRRSAHAAASLLLCFAALARAASLVRGPAVGLVDDSTAAVVWWTDVPSDTRLDGEAPDGTAFSLRLTERVTRHVAPLRGLASGGRYRYQAYSDDAPMGAPSTLGAPRGPGETAFRFGVIGDTATGHIPADIADRLVESGADLVIH